MKAARIERLARELAGHGPAVGRAARRLIGGMVGAEAAGLVLDSTIWLVAEMACAGMTFQLPHAQPFAPASLRLH